jgi:hypothetical protein
LHHHALVLMIVHILLCITLGAFPLVPQVCSGRTRTGEISDKFETAEEAAAAYDDQVTIIIRV